MALEHTIAIAQINPTLGDLAGNAEKIVARAEQARSEGADIVIFPEMSVTGYPPNDLLLHKDFISDVQKTNLAIAENIRGITAIVGTVEPTSRGPDAKNLHNIALVMRNGKIIGRQAKTLLPTYDVFHEARYFTPATIIQPVLIDSTLYGITICEDMWDADYFRKPVAELIGKGAQAIINISASPWYIGKTAVRDKIIHEHALRHCVPFFYANLVGAQDELIFDGNSTVVNHDGTLNSRLASFEEDLKVIRFGTSSALPVQRLDSETFFSEGAILANPNQYNAEAFCGLALGLRDYFHKNHLKKAVLGLSGGIDSTIVAALAVEAIGPKNVLGIGMPSKNNPSSSLDDARELAQRLGIDFKVLPIASMYNAVMADLKPMFEGKPFDVTEENIQARLRMLALMAFTNKHGYTLLSTGDKSEVALGYCTLYGDMSGGISIISDLTKPEVYSMAKWYNHWKQKEIIPSQILEKQPSPELAPNQKAPFNYDRISPLLEQLNEGMTIDALREKGFTTDEIRHAYGRMRAMEFKRWQAPIALKCKPRSFGHGRIYPVTNQYVPSALFESAVEVKTVIPRAITGGECELLSVPPAKQE